eukprot:705-Chlamydomonas_euryale.AAC.1
MGRRTLKEKPWREGHWEEDIFGSKKASSGSCSAPKYRRDRSGERSGLVGLGVSKKDEELTAGGGRAGVLGVDVRTDSTTEAEYHADDFRLQGEIICGLPSASPCRDTAVCLAPPHVEPRWSARRPPMSSLAGLLHSLIAECTDVMTVTER